MSTGAQPPGGGVAPCPVCACCGKPAHTQGRQAISENQFYGLEPVTCTVTGKTVDADPPSVQSYIKKMQINCPKLFGQPPCNTYYIASSGDTDKIDKVYQSNKKRIKGEIGSPAGEPLSHRVPKAAGGCPVSKDNVTKRSDLSAECQRAEGTLGTRQKERSDILRIAAGL